MALVVVTGCSGYIGTVLTQELLKKGYRVRGTVRSLTDEAKVSHLRDLCPEAKYTLELFPADLLQPGSFQKAFIGAEYVFHTASPFINAPKDAQKDLVDPAVEGTKNVIREAANAKTVKRVILTASMATICGNQVELDPHHIWTENDWNDAATIANPYPYSKTLAEKAAWTLVKELGTIELVTIHPGFVFGPAPTPKLNGVSLQYMIDILQGKYANGAPPLYRNGVVDVRDVAHAHILAMEKPNAKGRYICASRSQAGIFEIAQIVEKNIPGKYNVPKKLLDPTKGPRINGTDHSKIINELGLEFTPFETTIMDTVHCFEKYNIIKK